MNNYILCFDVPKKIRTTEEHNKMFMSDSGVNGTYVPNMSKDDMLKWKAKHIKGEHERIEIRKTFKGTQLLIIVYKKEFLPPYPKAPRNSEEGKKEIYDWNNRHEKVVISMNGKLSLSLAEVTEMHSAITEAVYMLI